MAKLIVLFLMVAGFYALSMAFFPIVWVQTGYQIPYTSMFFSWGMALMGAVIFLGMQVKTK